MKHSRYEAIGKALETRDYYTILNEILDLVDSYNNEERYVHLSPEEKIIALKVYHVSDEEKYYIEIHTASLVMVVEVRKSGNTVVYFNRGEEASCECYCG